MKKYKYLFANGCSFVLGRSTGTIDTGDDNAYDLGSPDKIWRHLYVGSGSINFMS